MLPLFNFPAASSVNKFFIQATSLIPKVSARAKVVTAVGLCALGMLWRAHSRVGMKKLFKSAAQVNSFHDATQLFWDLCLPRRYSKQEQFDEKISDATSTEDMDEVSEPNLGGANIEDSESRTVLHTADEMDSVDATEEAQPELEDAANQLSYSDLNRAILLNEVDTIQAVIEARPELLDATDDKGHSVLHKAILSNSADVIREIIEAKPELLDATDDKGNSVLHAAVLKGRENVINMLIAAKPELLGAVDHKGNTVLHKAVVRGHVDVIDMLIAAKPELVDAKNRFGQTALDGAMVLKRVSSIAALIKARPELADVTDDKDQTAQDILTKHSLADAISTVDG